MPNTRTLLFSTSVLALAAVLATGATAGTGKPVSARADPPVKVQVFAPRPGDIVGKASKGFFVDLALQYPSLASSGADLQLTGPGAHQNQAPFPGAFAPGVDEKLPGLIVLLSTSTLGARSAQNLANLFNLTGFTNQKTNEIWDTWLVGAPAFGRNVRSVLRVAVAADKNKDGVYNDAPATVPDANHDVVVPAQVRRRDDQSMEAPAVGHAQHCGQKRQGQLCVLRVTPDDRREDHRDGERQEPDPREPSGKSVRCVSRDGARQELARMERGASLRQDDRLPDLRPKTGQFERPDCKGRR